jgi:hypothetical protein
MCRATFAPGIITSGFVAPGSPICSEKIDERASLCDQNARFASEIFLSSLQTGFNG